MIQSLKLSKETIAVLKNFQTINSCVYIRAGNLLTTMAPGKSILARYDCPETFQMDVGIYALDKLLSILSMFDDPDIELYEKHLLVKSGKHEARVKFSPPSELVFSEKNTLDMPEPDVTLQIDENHIKQIIKLSAVLGTPEVAFIGDGSKVWLSAVDASDMTKDQYRIEVGESDREFRVFFKTTNLKLIPASYTVDLSSKYISKFTSENLTYWIAMERVSAI
jgi:hypothetical protein